VSAKPKQIVVDKEALVGININDLCDFARNHLLLACDTLLYECATTSKTKRADMVSRYKGLVEAGAYYCSCSVTYIKSEAKNPCPYSWFLPDLEATEQIRTGRARLEDALDPTITAKTFQSLSKVAKAMFIDLSAKVKHRIDMDSADVGKEIRQLPPDAVERYQQLFERIDADSIHQMCVDSIPDEWIKDKANFCSSPEWMSWQHVRLMYAIVQNYCYLRKMGGGPGDTRAEHDYQDMEYVLLLSRADGLLTNDEGCSCLAQAAFPEKRVFRTLDEVPEDYVCHWS
jgi:hypothetical protein